MKLLLDILKNKIVYILRFEKNLMPKQLIYYVWFSMEEDFLYFKFRVLL